MPATIFRIPTLLIVLLASLATSGAQNPPGPPPPAPPAGQTTAQSPQPDPAAATGENFVIRTRVSDVRIVVQVMENNETLKGLTKDDFVVTDQDQPQPVAYFGQEKDPIDLLLLLDISGSMREHIQQMSQTAKQALNYLTPGDRIAIMTFGIRTNLHFRWFDNHAEVARQLSTAPEDQEKVGYGTAINKAIIDATKYMASDNSPGRHSILIVTDNLGINYQANDELTIGYLLKADAVLNAIVIGRGIRPGPAKPGDNPDFTPADVFRLADATGGEAVHADEAGKFFAEMVARIRDRYVLSYPVPAGSRPGQFRRVTVNLTPAARKLHPQAIVRARSGYYVRQ